MSLLGSALGGVLLVAGHGFASVSVVALAVLGLAVRADLPHRRSRIVTDRFPAAAGAAASRIGLLAAMGGMALPVAAGRGAHASGYARDERLARARRARSR